MRGKGRCVLFIVLDGAADRPAAELEGQTPLEAAETPHLDRLAENGISGLVDIGPPGTPLPSDRAHARLFGYDPETLPRRSVFETRGLGIQLPKNGIVCSVSFARATEEGNRWLITNRKIHDIREHCRNDAALVGNFHTSGVDVSLEYTWKNRGILTVTAEDDSLDPGVTDTDPFETGLPVVHPEPTNNADDLDGACLMAETLAAYTRWSADRLQDGASDIVLAKWAGAQTDVQRFSERQGMSAVSLTSKPVLAGLAETIGMNVTEPPEPYQERAETVFEAVNEYEFVHAHYPEPDEVAHAETPTAKRNELEAIDTSLEPIVDRALEDSELVTVVTADHTTPSVGNVVHSGESVSVTMTAPTVRVDSVDRAGERPATFGGLGRVRGQDLLRLARAAADRVLLEGLQRTPHDGNVPTTDVRPLTKEGP